MAEASNETHLWHPDHNESSQTNIVDHEELQAILIKNIPTLAANVELKEDFWNLLLMGGVLNKDTRDYIKARKTRQAQSLALLGYLMECKVYQMHAFFWALVNSGQYSLVKQINLSVNDYLDVDIFMKFSKFRCPGCHEAYTIAYLLTGCGHYVCHPCVKASKITVDGKEEITCPIADCGEITEASPSEENIGLDEEAFTALCQMVDSTQAGAELPIEEEENQEPTMNVRAGIHAKMTRLEKHKDALTKRRKTIEEWFHTHMDKYTSVEARLVKVIQQSVHWMKVVDDLSVLLTAQPELKHGLKLPQLSLSSDSIKLMNELMSGCSVEELKTLLEKIPDQLLPTPSFNAASLRCIWQPKDNSHINEVFWTSNGHLLVFIGASLWQLTLDDAATQITSVTNVYNSSEVNIARPGFWMGKDGTWTCQNKKGIVEIHKFAEQEVKKWRPTHVSHPYKAVVGTDYIFVIGRHSDNLRQYNMNREFIAAQQLEVLKPGRLAFPQMDICEAGNLLIWNQNGLEVYIVSPLEKVVKCQTSQCQLRTPISVCEGPDDSILVIDGNNKLCVFASDGEFLYDININEDIGTPTSVSVLTRSGRPSLLALNCQQVLRRYDPLGSEFEIHIYALE